jgi:hypothetical protein
MNDTNGGSVSVTVAKNGAPYEDATNLEQLLDAETELGLDGLGPYLAFAERVAHTREQLRDFLDKARASGRRVYGLGASTKGNVILQYCGVNNDQLPVIGEVNTDKVGCFTPGTLIAIRHEDEVLASRPDYLLVFPWHFRRFFEASPKLRDTRLAFPLPTLSVSGS